MFVPSTPNPTTGYFLLVPEVDVIDTGLSVEEAFKLIISAGIATQDGAGSIPLVREPVAPATSSPAASADSSASPRAVGGGDPGGTGA